MEHELTSQQEGVRRECRDFVDRVVVPHADAWDRNEALPRSVVVALARHGYFGAAVPERHGGRGLDPVAQGLIHEEFGRGCSSVRSILTVHGMIAQVIGRWGREDQRRAWLPRLATGEVLAAFALTEPAIGCDASHIETAAVRVGDDYVLRGRKRWITGGQIADVFLVFAQCQGRPTAFLVGASTPGLTRTPMGGLLGVRASMLAELEFADCRVPASAVVGKVGFGVSHVAASALDHGRLTVAWGCVGIGQAALEASGRYASRRRQFGTYLRNHQLVLQMIADMVVSVDAARLLCLQASRLRQQSHPRSIVETTIAKYFASTMVMKVAGDAVQIHGAMGCGADAPVQRYFRDAKIMEIIEGSSQMQQIMIGTDGCQSYGAAEPVPQARVVG